MMLNQLRGSTGKVKTANKRRLNFAMSDILSYKSTHAAAWGVITIVTGLSIIVSTHFCAKISLREKNEVVHVYFYLFYSSWQIGI